MREVRGDDVAAPRLSGVRTLQRPQGQAGELLAVAPHLTPVIPKSRILGTGHYAPERVVSNADLEKIVDTSAKWIAERTGIRRRHLAAEHELTSDMAAAASRRALEAAGLNAADLDMIIVGTIYGLLQIGLIDRNRASRRSDVLKNARAAMHLISRDALNDMMGNVH